MGSVKWGVDSVECKMISLVLAKLNEVESEFGLNFLV